MTRRVGPIRAVAALPWMLRHRAPAPARLERGPGALDHSAGYDVRPVAGRAGPAGPVQEVAAHV